MIWWLGRPRGRDWALRRTLLLQLDVGECTAWMRESRRGLSLLFYKGYTRLITAYTFSNGMNPFTG